MSFFFCRSFHNEQPQVILEAPLRDFLNFLRRNKWENKASQCKWPWGVRQDGGHGTEGRLWGTVSGERQLEMGLS